MFYGIRLSSRYSPNVRSRLFGSRIGRRHFHISTVARLQDEPLRILFCGTDPFSIESLKALHAASKTNKIKISSIDVVTKKDKRSGRGLKLFKPPPIKSVAHELGLPLHQIDTFTGWSPPSYEGQDINLVIAVSFGLLIPSRILQKSKYGGLNVHPSILPDLRGAAPIQWTIMQGRSHTGVSIQTLHHSKFDEGEILDQTASPGIEIPNFDTITFEQLRSFLAPIGAEMLVNALQRKLYTSQSDFSGTQQRRSPGQIAMAPRITAGHKAIDFASMTLEDILRRNRAIPRLFATVANSDKTRIVFEKDLRAATDHDIPIKLRQMCSARPIGIPYAITNDLEDVHQATAPIYINVNSDNEKSLNHLVIPSVTVAGSPSAPAVAAVARNRLLQEPILVGEFVVHDFVAPLLPVYD